MADQERTYELSRFVLSPEQRIALMEEKLRRAENAVEVLAEVALKLKAQYNS